MVEFVPVNDLEKSLMQAQSGQLPVRAFIEKLVASDVALPSGDEIKEDGSGFQPLLFDKEGTSMVAVFTDKERVKRFSNITNFCLTMNALEFLRRIPKKFGIVINPGFEIGLDISPDGIAEILRDFG